MTPMSEPRPKAFMHQPLRLPNCPVSLPTAAMLAIAMTLAACGPKDAPPTTVVKVPAVEAPASAPTPSAAPVAASAAADLPLNCDDSVTLPSGSYLMENNSWGKKGVVGWSQCVGVGPSAKGGVAARWTWDWRYEGDQVKAYPEIIYGHKPGYPKSSTPNLPKRLRELQSVTVEYDVAVEREGAGNMAIDMWLTNAPNPTMFAAPPITHEVMIWLEAYGPMYAGGQQVDKVRINGTMYRVFVGEKFGLGWRYVAFAPNSPMQTSGRVDLMPFFEYLKTKNLMTTEEHLAAVNFGNEIISGAGETRLNHFAVKVQ
jgi:hypothetical protein